MRAERWKWIHFQRRATSWCRGPTLKAFASRLHRCRPVRSTDCFDCAVQSPLSLLTDESLRDAHGTDWTSSPSATTCGVRPDPGNANEDEDENNFSPATHKSAARQSSPDQQPLAQPAASATYLVAFNCSTLASNRLPAGESGLEPDEVWSPTGRLERHKAECDSTVARRATMSSR